ncbi:hypothetical protein ACFYXM_01655 [Streptomyces sp. NPDC002476]|uniref:hypothetical protein n=1 Tax=Streptomyces sp. NPDC002476 TaxID=3364648 RepID=UPI0036B0B677
MPTALLSRDPAVRPDADELDRLLARVEAAAEARADPETGPRWDARTGTQADAEGAGPRRHGQGLSGPPVPV